MAELTDLLLLSVAIAEVIWCFALVCVCVLSCFNYAGVRKVK